MPRPQRKETESSIYRHMAGDIMKEITTLRIAGIIRESIVDGPGIRFVIFGQGCPHNCPGCHNPQSHDFGGGYDCTVDKILEETDRNPLLKGVTFSGGEPFCQAEEFAFLGAEIRQRGLSIVTFTGYTYEELTAMNDENTDRLLEVTDLLIDGRYMAEQRDLTLRFRGSRNQRIIDMNKTRETGSMVLAEEYM